MRQKVHSYIYLAGLLIVAFFMPLSMFVTNAAILMIVANWFVECNYKEKWHRLKENKGVLIFCALFAVHIVWLANTSNFDYAVSDIRIKLPLLAIPIALGTSSVISTKKLNLILLSFVSGVLCASLIGFFYKIFGNSVGFRSLSLFVSNIRFSLMLCLSLFILLYFAVKMIFFTRRTTWIAVLVGLWFLVFMSMIQTITGFVCFLFVLEILLVVYGVKQWKAMRGKLSVALAIIIPLAIAGAVLCFVHDFYTPTCDNVQLATTANGIPYDVVKSDGSIENGNYVWINVSRSELEASWSNRSSYPLDSLDNKGQSIYSTLVRYMTSLGLTKDAEGVSALTDADVANVENGETNCRFVGGRGILNRIYVIIWEFDVYRKTGECNGHSVIQRIEYQKYGFELVHRNILTGIGVGDVEDEYQALYEEDDCPLALENRHRAHNQFLTFLITFGIFGFLICLFAWFYPALSGLTQQDYYFGVFFLIATLSMFSDDTLETSTGAVFVAFFYSLLMWSASKKEKLK